MAVSLPGCATAFLVTALTFTSVQGQEVPTSVAVKEEAPPARLPVICLVLPLSGPYEGLGRRVQRTIQGVLDGELVTVRALDGHGPGFATQIERARDAGCDLVIGGLGDRESLTLSEVAEAATIPLLALGRNMDDQKRNYVIAVRTPRSETVAAMAQHAIEAAGRTAAHILVPDTAFGREVAGVFRAAFEAGGGYIRSERTVPVGEELARTAAMFAAARAAAAHGRGGVTQDASLSTGCEREVLFLGFDLTSARRLVSLLEFEGVPVRDRTAPPTRPQAPPRGAEEACPPVLVTGTALWNDRVRVSRLGDELDGARFADVALPEGERDVLEAEVRDAAFLAQALLKDRRLAVRDAGEGVEVRDSYAIGHWADGLRFRGATGDLEVRGGRVVGRTLGVFEIRRGEVRAVTDEPAP